MPIIITFLIAIFLIGISWTWHNLGNLNKTKKVVTIIISFLIMFFATLIVFNISANNINYENKEIEQNVRNVLVIVFTIINSLIVIPQFAKTFGRINDNSIQEGKAGKHLVLMVICTIVLLVIESNYLKGIQQGILDIYHMKG